MEMMALLLVNQFPSSDLCSISFRSKPHVFSERRSYWSNRSYGFDKAKVLASYLFNGSEVPRLCFSISMSESSLSERYSVICLIDSSMVLISPNRWSPSSPLCLSSAPIAFWFVKQSSGSIVRLVRVSSSLFRVPLFYLVENETQYYQAPSLVFLRSDMFDGGTGTHPQSPNVLIFLVGHLGPLVFGYWVNVKAAWTMILGSGWAYFTSSCWMVLLESVVLFGGLVVSNATLIYLMHPHCSNLAFVVLTSLPFTRFAVWESPIVTPLLKRATFPGRVSPINGPFLI